MRKRFHEDTSPDMCRCTRAWDEYVGRNTYDPAGHVDRLAVMDSLRVLADELETRISADLWPLPSYREMLFIK